MSLLMEALKKAERAKQAAKEQGEQAPAEQPGLQLADDVTPAAATVATPPPEETAATEAGSNPLLRDPRQARPDFPKLELESIDNREFELDPVPPRAQPAAQAAPAATVTEEKSRAAARTVFEAKESRSARSKRVPIIVGALVVLALLGGGGYWWVLKQSGNSLYPQNLAQVPPPAPRPAPVIAANATPGATPGAAAAPAATPAAPAQAAAEPEPAAPAKPARPARGVSRTNEKPAANAKVQAPPSTAGDRADAAAASIRVLPSSSVVNATLENAYRAYLAHELPAANNGYRAVLAADPANRDALLGLAGIAAGERRLDEAESLYLRILHLDPADAYAQTGLLAIRSQADPIASESRLKTLIAAQPNAAFLHYALGNLYARDGRWNEAQQEHFRATVLDADNPDYCYNLAVSLDRIRQSQLALAHYQRALALAANRPASFDPGQLRARITELQH